MNISKLFAAISLTSLATIATTPHALAVQIPPCPPITNLLKSPRIGIILTDEPYLLYQTSPTHVCAATNGTLTAIVRAQSKDRNKQRLAKEASKIEYYELWLDRLEAERKKRLAQQATPQKP